MAVAARHCLEDFVVAGLEGNVEMFADLGQFGAGFDQSFGEVAGVAGGKSKPIDAGDIVNKVEQVGEGVEVAAFGGGAGEVAAIGVDVLPQEGDFLEALGGELFDFGANGLGGAGLFDAAHTGDDAVGAAFVAAVDDIDPGGDGAVAAGLGDVFEDMDGFGGDDLVALEDAFEEILEAVGVLGSHDQIDFGDAAQEGFAFLLGDAACYDDRDVGVLLFAFGLASEVGVDLLFGVVADGAGVVEDDVGGEGVFFPAHAHGFEDARHAFGVGFVHLAAEGGDVVAAGSHGRTGPIGALQLRIHPSARPFSETILLSGGDFLGVFLWLSREITHNAVKSLGNTGSDKSGAAS